MCGIFGFMDYKHNQSEDCINVLCNSLAKQSESRGSHATGVAYVNNNALNIFKEPRPASKVNIKLPKGTSSVMGHTRHSTQGSEKKNINNHPFLGSIRNRQFAFAHNGIIYNDRSLRRDLKLPETEIETDSYIGVQLLETQDELSLKSHKYMAEQIQGSYTFSTLDKYNNLYITKGSSPVSMLHFKDMGLFVYASTETILWNAIMDTTLFGYIKKVMARGRRRSIEFIDIHEGEILKIASDGAMSRCSFQVNENDSGYGWYRYALDRTSYEHELSMRPHHSGFEAEYLKELIRTAATMGISSGDIALLYGMGYSLMDIEELIYDSEMFEQYTAELRFDFDSAEEFENEKINTIGR